ncbi:MAG: protein-export chaperone SecB [Wenzhouxiangellaceae bacterium]
MSEENQTAAGNGQTRSEQAQMAIQHVYLKDCSFEAPGALGLDGAQGQPDVQLNLAQRVNQLGDDRYEVVLTITVTARQGGKTAFIAEAHQAGIFLLQGFNQQQLAYVVNVHCPNVLFPYARAQIAALVAAGGFMMPPLQPISFEALHAQRMAQQQAAGTNGAADGGQEPGQA